MDKQAAVTNAKVIVASFLSSGVVVVNGWKEKDLRRGLRRLAGKYGEFLPICAFEADVEQFKRMTGIQALPARIAVEQAVPLFRDTSTRPRYAITLAKYLGSVELYGRWEQACNSVGLLEVVPRELAGR